MKHEYKIGDRVTLTWVMAEGRRARIVDKYQLKGAWWVQIEGAPVSNYPENKVALKESVFIPWEEPTPFEQSLYSYIQKELG